MKVKADLSGVARKIKNIASNRTVGMALSSACARYLDQYVPYLTGNLANDHTRVLPYEIWYETDYAKIVYEAKNITIHKTGHINARPHWDEGIKPHIKKIASEVTGTIKRL